MKKTLPLLIFVLALLASARAHAATCQTLSSGASQSQILAALNSCGSGNTLAFSAGTYGPITSTVLIPCGVSLSGPTVPYSQTPNQTATVNGSSGFIGWGLQTTSGCSASQTIQYLAWNGEQPGGSGGGGFLEINPGTTNLTVTNNWLHGVNAPSTDGGSAGQNIEANLINFGGGPGGAVISNVSILNNIFGSTSLSDCAGAITEVDTEDGGGYCNGVGMGANLVNVTIRYNIFHWLEQGMKFYEGQGECNPLTVSNNDYSHIQRIMYETQCNNLTAAMNMNIQYNSFHDRGVPGTGAQQNYDLSAANGCTNPTLNNPTNCVSHIDYNLDLQAATGQADVGVEIWGGTGTTGNYNYLQGYLYNGITWSASGQFVFNNNNFNLVANGTNTSCTAGAGGFWNRESNGETATPSCTGNTFSNAITGTTTSVAPTISPASGTFGSSQVVTITNPGANRDTNTTDWCTTDGSTPTPGSGTAVGYDNGGTLTVTSTATVNCVGMWGALNQPYSYPSGFGYLPSAVVSATYTLNAGPVTLQNVTVAATGGATGMQVGQTLQMIAACHYSDGTTTGCNSVDAHGNAVTAWSSTATAITINAGGVATGASIGSANITATVTGGDVSPAYTLTVGAAPLTLATVSLATTGGVSSITAGGTNQLIATCNYSDGTQTSCGSAADSHGNIVDTWSSSAPTIATVSTAGLVTGVAAGSTSLTAIVIPQPAQMGNNTVSYPGTTAGGTIDSTYFVTGTAAGGYQPQSCNVYIAPGTTIPSGMLFDCIITAAPTPSTQAADATCSGRAAVPSGAWTGPFLSISMSSCPALSQDSAYWVGTTQNQTTFQQGLWSCSTSTSQGQCSTSPSAPPLLGSGTYGYYYLHGTFGTYTGMGASLSSGGPSQITQYLTVSANPVTSSSLPLAVTAAPPTLSSAYLAASESSLVVGATVQMSAHCVYVNPAATTDCTVPDIYGNGATNWGPSNPAVALVSSSGFVTAVGAGSVSINAMINGTLPATAFALTVNAAAVTLTGISLATTNGVTGLPVGGTNALIATCLYSDGSSTLCNSVDSHGNQAGSFTSTNPAHATVNATTGLVTGVASGATTFTAIAGGFTSPAIPLTVVAPTTSQYTITITGPVKFSGNFSF